VARGPPGGAVVVNKPRRSVSPPQPCSVGVQVAARRQKLSGCYNRETKEMASVVGVALVSTNR